MSGRAVVAVVLTWRERVGLFKRSSLVRYDAGAWHCITGYLDPGRSSLQQAAEELWEETGLGIVNLERLEAGPVLRLPDARDGQPWIVHTFRATTRERRLTLNWEHDRYRWVRPAQVRRFDGQVPWLADVLAAATR
jgi:8-oxo-dGTP pyrophosphatase MutT (NUDIX family)